MLEPWLPRGRFNAGVVSLEAIDRDEIKLARMQRGTIEAGRSLLNFDYLLGTSETVQHFTERHELGLFSHDDMQAALKARGLTVQFDPEGFIGCHQSRMKRLCLRLRFKRPLFGDLDVSNGSKAVVCLLADSAVEQPHCVLQARINDHALRTTHPCIGCRCVLSPSGLSTRSET